ncbi:pseudaminic acid synthase [Candidatus Kaiserbacteria bacterium CG10_big_fil_rev_8_21_14_0_10_59_10]|uniref:Pseudaminic acid synthase n=1 Tax=Candidatus Kaiserbacteria bacterium CG10_big_fil_rev_8_21_14_0_10_59_10 TaxID=1974612 RepID=A0A2H0U7S5_9BACT|nr:MAG: pseudaminic acid synthase [Candidatus Kaiserbacteria bacterium CG10_big_fil_rev_8_21_14_0_10_59_10]
MVPLVVSGRKIGPGEPCFIVAEISANHHQKYEEAEALVKAAKAAGADAVKFQTYTPDTMTIDSDKKWFFLEGENTPESWKKSNLYDLYATAYTPWEWQPKLKELAEELGIAFFSTPFDETAVDFLEEMDVPCYKIASYEATDIPLLKKVASTGKPVILSIGFAELHEVEEAVRTVREAGAREVALLHCVTAYADEPRPECMNLRTIRDIAERFDVVSGFSDNNAGIEAPVASVYAGASIVEKHFMLDRSTGGPDSRFSVEPDEFAEMVRGIRRAEVLLGRVRYGPAGEDEKNYKKLRRSLFAVSDIKKGDVFTPKNVRVIRPAYGLSPNRYDDVIGRRAAHDIERGTPLSEGDVVQ